MGKDIIIAYLKGYGYMAFLGVVLLVMLSVVAVREYNVASFKETSVEHTVVITLKKGCGEKEMDAIRQNLEYSTSQPVQGRAVDSKVYMLKIHCPPDKAVHFWHWLSDRRWIEKVEPQN